MKARSYLLFLIAASSSVILVVALRPSLNQWIGYHAQRPFVAEITYCSGDLQIEWFGRSEYQSRLIWFDDGHGQQVQARWQFNPFRPIGEGFLCHSWRFGITPRARDGAVAAPAWAFVGCLFFVLISISEAIRFAQRRTKLTNHNGFEVITEGQEESACLNAEIAAAASCQQSNSMRRAFYLAKKRKVLQRKT